MDQVAYQVHEMHTSSKRRSVRSMTKADETHFLKYERGSITLGWNLSMTYDLREVIRI